ncbi:hypothetical protein ACHAQA_003861 [Verticillium albo-atrum]
MAEPQVSNTDRQDKPQKAPKSSKRSSRNLTWYNVDHPPKRSKRATPKLAETTTSEMSKEGGTSPENAVGINKSNAKNQDGAASDREAHTNTGNIEKGSENNATPTTLTHLEAGIKSFTAAITRHGKDLRELKDKDADFQKEIQELKGKNAEFEKEIQELKGKNAEFEKETQELKDKNAELQKDIQELKGKNADFEKDNQVEDRAEIDRMRAQGQSAVDAARKLEIALEKANTISQEVRTLAQEACLEGVKAQEMVDRHRARIRSQVSPLAPEIVEAGRQWLD